MLKHEHFEEICAAASVGQASPEELVELEQHAAGCDACRESYASYLNVAARQFAEGNADPTISADEAQQCLNSELFTLRFFERAQKEGIVFSDEAAQAARNTEQVVLGFRKRSAWRVPMAAAAAVLLAIGVVRGIRLAEVGFDRRNSATLHSKQTTGQPVQTVQPVQPAQSVQPGSAIASQSDARVAELVAANRDLRTRMDALKTELSRAEERLRTAYTDREFAVRDSEAFRAERDRLESQLDRAQQALAESQMVAASAQQESRQLRSRSAESEASLVAAQTKVTELTQQLTAKSNALDQERQLLAVGHDVSDLMGARNLHIVDVVDTDPGGKTRPSFGRIFFTENKSLVFYAYDLNEAKVQRANYQYRIWAKKEGDNKAVRNLGIFYSDDKAQQRWVYKCNDPKILSEIDSVFVTLEPAESDASRPKGQNLMYAYLRGQPNHP